MSENTGKHYCLNCNKPYPEEFNLGREIFCAYCGQSNRDSKLSFGRLLKDAVSNVLNLDSRLIHTFRDIFRPSKLTKFYIQGRRKYYVNPARLFIFTLIALVTLSLYCITLENSTFGVDSLYSKAERSKMLDEFIAMTDTIDIIGHEDIVDTIQSKLFDEVAPLKKDTLGKNSPQLFNLGKPVDSFGITRYDGIHLTQKELFTKYNITKYWDKINVGQYIRLVTNPAGGIKHVIKNLTWAIFITVVLLSFFMKLLYIRKPYYLVEHAVLILNSHSLLFIIIAINLIVIQIAQDSGNMDDLAPILSTISILSIFTLQFLTLKKYYKQGIFKTLLKQLMINSAYITIFFMTVSMVAIISLILY